MFDLGATGTTFGVGTASDVEELNKALTAGYGRGGDQTDGALGAPLRVESLENTLKVLTFSEKHIVMWRDIPKLPAFNTVEEFNQLSSYGNSGGYFVPEGTTPQESDSTYTRRNVTIKYVGSLRKVTHQMTLVRPAHGDVIALETMNGTREILRTVEEGLFFGDSACLDAEWDGLEAQFRTGVGLSVANNEVDNNVIDMRGASLSQATLADAAKIVMENYGFATQMYLGYDTMTKLNNLFVNKEQLWLNQQAPAGAAGFALQAYNTMGGQFAFRPSVFLKQGDSFLASDVAGGVGARGPVASRPAASGAVSAAAAGSGSLFAAGDAGNYDYAVILENRFGWSTAVATTVTTAVTAGQVVTVTVNGLPASLQPGQMAIRIYRKRSTDTTFRFMKRLPVANNTPRGTTYSGTTFTYTDRNTDIPGTNKAFLVQMDLDVISFKQLAPFTKIPLATIDPSIRWMQLLYGTPALYAPRKLTVIKNIG